MTIRKKRTVDGIGPHETVDEGTPAHERNLVKRFLKMLGPGLITGAADDDPSGIGTYSVSGAQFGFATLWIMVLTVPMMASVQYICAKIGRVSGQGIASILRKEYPRTLLYPVVFTLAVANTINAGVDLGAIGAATHLLLPVPALWAIVPAVAIILGIQIWGSYKLIIKSFEWLCLALFAYIGSAFFSKPDFAAVLRGTLVPTIQFNRQYIATLVAILGTTISPYLFFWVANQEVEMDISRGKRTLEERQGASESELTETSWDVNTGMVLSNIVSYFIILSTAATLHVAGKTSINSAADAAEALRPIAGSWASVLFALGMIGSGFLAVPVLTGSAAYAIAETFRWRRGLDVKPRRAKEFYAVIALSTLLGMGINYLNINPMGALFWTAVINGFLAPPLLILIMLISNNKKIMGDKVNSTSLNILGWATTLAMLAAVIGMILTE